MFARTPRLLLRPGWKEDAPAVAEALGDYAVAAKLTHVPWPYLREDAEAWLSAEKGPLPQLLIFARTHGAPRLVGGIGLAQAGAAVEMGYWIARPYWGLGFATEAGRAVIDMADKALRLPRLVSVHFVDNPASGRVLRKLGFEPTGQISTRLCKSRNSVEPCVEYVRAAFAAAGKRTPADIGYDREAAIAA